MGRASLPLGANSQIFNYEIPSEEKHIGNRIVPGRTLEPKVNYRDAVVIGGGPAGIGFLIGVLNYVQDIANDRVPQNAIKRELIKGLKIALYEKEDFQQKHEFNSVGGSPYNLMADPSSLVNDPKLSFDTRDGDRRKDFYNWYQENYQKIKEQMHENFVLAKQDSLIPDEKIALEDIEQAFELFEKRILKPNLEKIDQQRFYIPRQVFGIYLRDKLSEFKEKLSKSGIDLEIKPGDEVQSLRLPVTQSFPHSIFQAKEAFKLKTKSGSVESSQIIDASGHWLKAESKSRILNPWSVPKLKEKVRSAIKTDIKSNINKLQDGDTYEFNIGFKGLNLSFIDLVKALSYGDFKEGSNGLEFTPKEGRINIDGKNINVKINLIGFSRSGRLPTTIYNTNTHKSTFSRKYKILRDTPITAKYLDELFKQEVKDSYKRITGNDIDPDKYLSRIMDLSEGSYANFKMNFNKSFTGDEYTRLLVYQDVIERSVLILKLLEKYPGRIYKESEMQDGEIRLIPSSLQELKNDSLLMKFYYSGMISRESAEELKAYLDSGQLQVFQASKEKSIDVQEDRVTFTDANNNEYRMNLLIDVTGQESNTALNPSPLFQDLIEERIAGYDDNGLVSMHPNYKFIGAATLSRTPLRGKTAQLARDEGMVEGFKFMQNFVDNKINSNL